MESYVNDEPNKMQQETALFRRGETPEGYDALRLGSTIVSWTPSQFVSEDRYGLKIVAVMNGSVYDIDAYKLRGACKRYGLLNFDEVLRMGHSSSHVILNLPSGSLDVPTFPGIYGEHSTKTLLAALFNHFQLLQPHIQSVLNHKTRAEAREIILMLALDNYGWRNLLMLSWQGSILNDLLDRSGISYFMSYSQKLSEPLIYQLGEGAKNSQFDFFLRMQAVEVYQAKGRILRKYVPGNTFFVKAESEAELTLGRTLFNETYLDRFLEGIGDDADPEIDRIFFFGLADSCLADWIIGKTITVSELHEFGVSEGLL